MSTGRQFTVVGSVDGTSEVAVVLDPAYAGFQGHFPGDPVLPGMCHVDLAVRAASLACGRTLSLTQVQRARFLIRVRPNDDLRIAVRIEASEDGIALVRATHRVGISVVAELVLRAN